MDHEGEVLEVFATKCRDRRAKFLKRTMKRYGQPWSIVTDRLRSCGAAMKVIGNLERQVSGRWFNNRAENSHQPFRRREGAMARFWDIKILQKFASAHASIHNHFNQDRHLNRRDVFKQNRAAALAEWLRGAIKWTRISRNCSRLGLWWRSRLAARLRGYRRRMRNSARRAWRRVRAGRSARHAFRFQRCGLPAGQ